MKRTITSRNLAGGFLGGFLGILVSGYTVPWALPIGVLVGVIVGWWTKDVLQMFIHSCRNAYGFWHSLVEYTVPDEIRLPQVSLLKSLKEFFLGCGVVIGKLTSPILRPIALNFKCVAKGVRAIVNAFAEAARWTTHPSSKALLISITAIVLGAAVNTLVAYTVIPTGHEENDVLLFFAVFMTSILGACGVLIEYSKNNSMESFFARWERYSQYRPLTYLAIELLRFFKWEAVFIFNLIVMIVYWVTLGGALFTFVVMPVAVFVCFMVGFYKIAQRSAHWWCLGVTLVVTSISALIFYKSFSNELILWTVALCNGIVCGVVTEGLRRFSLWWSETESGWRYLNIWYDWEKVLIFSIATETWGKLGRTYETMVRRCNPLFHQVVF